ncbi:unknown; predicted coding region [Mycoplasmopsis pulmonis]|uniref:Uncharacterized protein n=1 Tax=Mycoplasmopsis pulmonis (strain UAB CTIP) TaxID=272635 RepID=Q98QB9_MYCPU|nr:hypothetical protein [Mycoplasmopsis pulmonis]MDZ7293542.1 hypothetical protein [Mycoplasmopsis pulmonis]CAC13620.1 unknown; predicted coding region [Mycoplasmopsis pulmonis]VEU68212.1 Uncharacterised protein [Mycoplasmopsis pulmonis]
MKILNKLKEAFELIPSIILKARIITDSILIKLKFKEKPSSFVLSFSDYKKVDQNIQNSILKNNKAKFFKIFFGASQKVFRPAKPTLVTGKVAIIALGDELYQSRTDEVLLITEFLIFFKGNKAEVKNFETLKKIEISKKWVFIKKNVKSRIKFIKKRIKFLNVKKTIGLLPSEVIELNNLNKDLEINKMSLFYMMDINGENYDQKK